MFCVTVSMEWKATQYKVINIEKYIIVDFEFTEQLHGV